MTDKTQNYNIAYNKYNKNIIEKMLVVLFFWENIK